MEAIKEWLTGTRPYNAGVTLYLAFGKDPLLLKLFKEPHSAFKEAKLVKVMEALCSGVAVKKPAKILVPEKVVKDLTDTATRLEEENEELHDQIAELQDEKEQLEDINDGLLGENKALEETNKKLVTTKTNSPRGWPAVMDDTLQKLYSEWLVLFSDKKNLQSRLHAIAKAGEADAEKKKEAGRMAHRILDLRDACRVIYTKRDTYTATGKLPEEPRFTGELVTDPRKWPKKLANHERYLRDYKVQLSKATEAAAIERIENNIKKQEAFIAEYKKMLGDVV